MVSVAGVITTVAGDGTAGYAGDGGEAVKAELNGPEDTTVSPSGDLYIADGNNNRIRVVYLSGATSANNEVFRPTASLAQGPPSAPGLR